MTGTLAHLFAAMLGFVGSHFLLSFPPVRRRLTAVLGEKPFLGVYTLVAFAFLAWVIFAYRAAPVVPVWNLGAAGRHLALLLMPLALVLVVMGITSPSPTGVGGERRAAEPLRGILTVTRHPFLWGAALWAAAHLAANGDAASLLLFGGMGVLALGGMAAIDHKRAATLGEAWEGIRRRTSAVPFVAALQGRTPIDWAGMGAWRVALGLVLYVVLLFVHRWLFGVSPLAL